MTRRSSSRTSTSKNRSRGKAERAARSAYLEQKRAASVRRYWHGGPAGLTLGTILIPRAEAERQGLDTTLYDLQAGHAANVTDPERVYFASDREVARAFAGRIQVRDAATGVLYQHGTLYEVVPLGEIESDSDIRGDVSWCAPRAQIVAVEEVNVRLNAYEVTERLGPHSTWTDGSPVYTPDGRYIPSPEQIAFAGVDAAHAMADTMLPWTPVDFVNAAIAGQPTGDRPGPEDYPDVLLGGAEVTRVMRKHRERTASLLSQGVRFETAARTDLEDLNRLLSLAGNTTVGVNDTRGIVTATHPRDGLLGAVVFTGVDFSGQFAMLVDAVTVTASWRRRGLGSVMLLSAQQLLPRPVSFAAGHCDPMWVEFFAQAGFSVLRPGAGLVFPFGDEPNVLDTGAAHCWVYRQGPL